MKHIPALLFAAAFALASASAAQALTFESTAPGDGSGVHQNYTDPDDQMQPKAGSPQRFDSGSNSQQGGFHMNFGGQTQSFDQKYNSNDYFSPTRR